MLMADYGVGLWDGYADFEPIENDNLSIDVDSFMDLLQEEPSDAQINSERLLSSDFLIKDLFPGTGAPELDIRKLETRIGNYGSTVDTGMGFFGSTENSSCMQMSMLLDMPVKDEACTGSSTSHYSSSTFGDNISPFTDYKFLPVHYNSDYRQSFHLDKEMSAGTKVEARTHVTEEKTYITSNNGGLDWSGPRTSSGILSGNVSDVVGPDCQYEFGHPFPVLDGSYSTGPNHEGKEQPFSWGSLYMSTFSSNNQVVKDESLYLTVPSSNIGSSYGATIRNNFSFAEKHHVSVKEEDKKIDLARSNKDGCYPVNGSIEDESPSKLLQPNGTDILHCVPASVHQHGVNEKDRRIGMAAPKNISQNSCIDDENSGTLVLPNVTNATPSNGSPESTQSNSVDYRSQVDDESDLCIIEEMSHPAPSNRSVIPGRSLIVPKPSAFHESRHYSGLGGSRIKTHSERSVFQVAMQDLSQPKLELNPPDGALTVPLLRHQRIALAWMVKKETAVNCSGGILADDQGLGKTISTISLILKERPPSSKPCRGNMKLGGLQTLDLMDDEGNDDGEVTKSKVMKVDHPASVQVPSSAENGRLLSQKIGRPSGGTLVVCPTSVLRQWADELHNKVTAQANLSVLVYHGGSRTKDPFELAKYDVVVTTFSIVSMEVPKQRIGDKDEVENGKRENQDFPHAKNHPSKKRKNPSSSNKRKSKDGKEAGNGLLEATTAGPLAKVGWFRVILDEAQSIKNHKTKVARACWGLRAKRRWCLSGTPIQNAIDDLYSYFKFLRYDPYDTFTTFCTNIKTPIQRNPPKGYKKLQAILKTIMLRRTKGTLLDGEPLINLPPKSVILQKVEFSDHERGFYAKLEADSQAQFKEYAAAGTVRENYVNILLMLLRLRQACDHPLLVKGYNSSTELKSSVEMAKRLSVEKQRDLLNCLEASLAICAICNDPPEEAVVSMCGHVFCNQCLNEHITGDERECPATDCKARLSSRCSTFSKAALNVSLDGNSNNTSSMKPPIIMETTAEDEEACSAFGSSKIRTAIKVLQSLSKTQDSSPNNQGQGQNSPDEQKDSNNKPPAAAAREKAILFSQWTKMLDLIEACLKSSSIQYRRLDGTMTVTARDKAVKDFNTLPEVTVIIMSLKAASLGLNMVSANHVFLMDLWWNPTTEDQAIDRAHRIGQTRPVTVLRLTVKDTVEDRILALQQKKRVMVASAFGDDESGSRQTRLTLEDLNYLFMA